MAARIVAEVEVALGPGVEFERDQHGGLIGRRPRAGAMWLGFDRAALVESDDGQGRSIPVVVALPGSTYAGCRLEVEVVGGYRSDGRVVAVARLPGWPLPPASLALAAAGIRDEAEWLDQGSIDHVMLEAYQRYRDRRSHARIQGGRAWHAIGDLAPELARFATPHSAAEYSLAKVPPRFVRGLEGLLDHDERLLYAIERPPRVDIGLRERFRSARDRRAGLLLLTDRQVLWMVDHADPNRYLLDWGVDVWLAPIEQATKVTIEHGDPYLLVRVATVAEAIVAPLPAELDEEAEVFGRLLHRFLPAPTCLPRRRYDVDAIPFDTEPASRFGQADRATRLLEELRAAHGEPLAFLYSPSREGQREPGGVYLTERDLTFVRGARQTTVETHDVPGIFVSLSPLVGRISAGRNRDHSVAYPAPLGQYGAALVRTFRRRHANL